MKKTGTCALVIISVLSFYLSAENIQPVRRFALVVGSNFGGSGTQDLRYAANDAEGVSSILTQIGGIKNEDSLLLMNPSRDSLGLSFSHLGALMKRNANPAARVELLFYYSGHSDEQGLLLYGDHFTYQALKEAVSDLPADVHMVILDSCFSGTFTRLKGGSIQPPFLFDTANVSSGHAYLTSSTDTEDSQESDAIKSSFFTYALLTGLRGAADANNDGKVTLNEAYQYAFDETIVRTTETALGVQHPAYSINLTGIGNIVLTDIRNYSSRLVMEKGFSGKLYIRDAAENLVAELKKDIDQEVELSLGPGIYILHLEDGNNLYSQEFSLKSDSAYVVSSSDAMEMVERYEVDSKGADGKITNLDYSGLSVTDLHGTALLSLNFLLGKEKGLDGTMLSSIANSVEGDAAGVQMSLISNTNGLNGSGYQSSLFYNGVRGGYRGFQATLIFNNVHENYRGLQLGGALNHTRGAVEGVQFTGGANIAGTVSIGQIGTVNWSRSGNAGFQLGGLNFVQGSSSYGQYGVGGNISLENVSWAQLGMAFNITLDQVKGIQGGIGINFAKALSGIQIGLFNYSQSFTGVQAGLINFTSSGTGVQLGVLNISKELKGIPIGLIDIQKGNTHLEAWTEADRYTLEYGDLFNNIGIRFGSRFFYKILVGSFRIGWSENILGFPMYSAGVGIGFRIPILQDFFAVMNDFDISIGSYTQTIKIDEFEDPADFFVPSVRTLVEIKPFKRFGIYAGVVNRVYIENFNDKWIPPSSYVLIEAPEGRVLLNSRITAGIKI